MFNNYTMDVENKKDKKQPYKNSYKCARNFRYNGKDYKKGVDKIRLTKEQAKAAKKNNMI